MMIEHDEHKLPKWAQAQLQAERRRVADLEERMGRLEQMHALLSEHDWFTIPGPHQSDEQEQRKLFVLNRDSALCVCTLGKGDKLFVGRTKRERQVVAPPKDVPDDCPACGYTPYLAGKLGMRPTNRKCAVCGNVILEPIL